MALDRKAIARHLDHLKSQIDNLTAEISKGDDEYSPLMDWETFHEQLNGAVAFSGMKLEDACICMKLGAPAKHRCSAREYLVESFMSPKRKVPA